MSFLGDVFKIAAGVAVGNKISRDKKNDGSGRQNLFGTASCPYGKKVDGWTQSCPGCPMALHCTQRGRYNVGD